MKHRENTWLLSLWPTLSTLYGSNLIKAADLCSKQAEDFELYSVEAFDEIMHLTLPCHPDPVHTFSPLEHPTSGR